MTEKLNSETIKTQQRQQWDRAAKGWRKWWPRFEEVAKHISNRLIELAEIKAGQRVLDIATGIGEPALTAAKKVGPQGRVMATDQAAEMIAIGRERARESGFTNLEFKEQDAEGLDFPAQSFDAVLCRWGLMFLPNLKTALEKMLTVLRPGGYLAAAIWNKPDKVPWISLPMQTARQVLKLPAPAPGAPGPFSLSETSVLETVLRETGFQEIYFEPQTVIWKVSSVGEYLNLLRDVTVPLHALLADQSKERQEEVWQAIGKAAEKYRTADGSVAMTNEALCLRGKKPSSRP